jgi:hypothetical protein
MDSPPLSDRGVLAQEPSEHRLWAIGAQIEAYEESTEKVKEDVAELMKLKIPSRLFVC